MGLFLKNMAGALRLGCFERVRRFPPNGARLELANDGSGKPDPITLKVTGGCGALTVLVNGLPLPAAAGRRNLSFEPQGPGFVRLTVVDGRGALQ
jgi:penicillin-binding protein 1C